MLITTCSKCGIPLAVASAEIANDPNRMCFRCYRDSCFMAPYYVPKPQKEERPVIMGVMVGQLRMVLSVLSLQYRRFGRTNMKPDNYTYALAFERCSRCGKINWSVSYRQSQSNHVGGTDGTRI